MVSVLPKESRLEVGAVLVAVVRLAVAVAIAVVVVVVVRLEQVQFLQLGALTSGLGLKPVVILGATGASGTNSSSGSSHSCRSAGAARDQERRRVVDEVGGGARGGRGDCRGGGVVAGAKKSRRGERAARLEIEKGSSFQLLVTFGTGLQGLVTDDGTLRTLEKTLPELDVGGHGLVHRQGCHRGRRFGLGQQGRLASSHGSTARAREQRNCSGPALAVTDHR